MLADGVSRPLSIVLVCGGKGGNPFLHKQAWRKGQPGGEGRHALALANTSLTLANTSLKLANTSIMHINLCTANTQDAPYKKPYVSKAERLKPTMMDGTHARSVTLASVARGEAEGADSFALASPELRAVRFARKGVE